MDKIAELKETEISKIIFPTIGHFVPLLEEKRSLILSTPRRTFKYGPTERHKLDIYYPAEPAALGETPILFFIYGGGYTSGSRTLPTPADLAYANVGAYFTRKGFITIVPDYRLSPEVTYPAPSEDVRDAIVWIAENSHSLIYGNITDIDTDSLFVMAHSVGAVTVATIVLLSLLPENIQSKFKGIILISGPYTCDMQAVGPTFDPEVATQFFGSLEKAKENTPLSLLKNLPKDRFSILDRILLAESENDPEPFLRVGQLFQDALLTLTGKRVSKVVAAGHNHISITFALMSGQGEQWAEEVVDWMKAAV
ncbi:alpha beta hydrolase domain-containing protein [Lentinula aciculospora]|uniref:Alpha beta hydrolase domain-containing protein n=1 Tax=Lentinula aciculospora TaxID=153920 RepID=A0A9W9AW93_9AGAR|nr:alpha beta hydrolase domain-containing protein [Lentinula aciculospora]